MPWNVLGVTVLCIGCCWAQAPDNPFTGIRITEIQTRGVKSTRPPGEWVELYNGSSSVRDLTGCRIVHDDKTQTISDLRLEASAYAVIQPSFRLAGRGGSISLLAPEGEQVISELTDYPTQHTGVSYGLSRHGKRAFFSVPTPGTANGEGFLGVCQDVVFSKARGFYEKPFRVALKSSDPKVSIRYTLDGSIPSARHGERYRNELQVLGTTTLRAVALREGHIASRVVTNTYLFIDQVITQPARPRGFPKHWGRHRRHRIPGDYEMDPRVTRHTLPGYGLREALLDLPTVSVVMPVDDLFHARTGIYSHSEERGIEWERAMSMEWIDPNGGDGFQVNAGIRMQGHSSRRPERMQKHSFRVDFQSQYGVRKLNFPVFPGSPVKTFNKLVLRTPSTDSWALTGWMEDRYRPNDSQYVRDVWMKESLRAMGHPSGRSRYVHLYLNGLYWGIYILAERLDEDFFASHLGGQPEEWDIIRDFVELMAGNFDSWSQLNAQARAAYDPEVYQSFLGKGSPLHLSNFADYMLLHFLADAEDWPHHNFYAAAKRGDPFRFLVWDQEIVLDNHAMNRMQTTKPGPGRIFHGLMRQPAFRNLFADRVHRHLSPGGALSLSACQKRYRDLCTIIDKAIVAESARWGDTAYRTPYGLRVPMPRNANDHDDPFFPAPVDRKAPYMTRESSWVVERDNVLNNYLPAIFDPKHSLSFVNKLRANRLYPSIDPPVINGDGGAVRIFDRSVTVTLSKATPTHEGEIIYTLNGSDPRTPVSQGKAVSLVSEQAVKRATVPTNDRWDRARITWRDLGFDDSNWPKGTLGAGYEHSGGGGYARFIDPKLNMTGRVAPSANESIYLRTTFTVSDPASLIGLTLRMRYDDGYIAYINGVEVARANANVRKPVWNTPASSSHPDTDATVFEMIDIKAALPVLRKGQNVLAVQALNDDPRSSDFLIHPILDAVERIDSQLAANSSGIRYEKPITLTEPATVRAAVKLGNEWSALVTVSFVTTAPASAGNIVISEIMYHPENDDDAEFVEICNVSSEHAVWISGMRLEGGIDFNFPWHEPLMPGDRAVVAKDSNVFRKDYGNRVRPIGVYLKSLSNSTDTLLLKDAAGQLIEEISYEDTSPWPVSADGEGWSLERRLDDLTSAPSNAESWKASISKGGTPGT